MLMVDPVKGIGELVENGKECVVMERDPARVVEQITTVLADYGRYEAVKRAGHRRALASYTWDHWSAVVDREIRKQRPLLAAAATPAPAPTPIPVPVPTLALTPLTITPSIHYPGWLAAQSVVWRLFSRTHATSEQQYSWLKKLEHICRANGCNANHLLLQFLTLSTKPP